MPPLEADLCKGKFYSTEDPDQAHLGYRLEGGEPCFELPEALDVAEQYAQVHSKHQRGRDAHYDAQREVICLRDPTRDEWIEIHSLKVGSKKLYPIGRYVGTWRELEMGA